MTPDPILKENIPTREAAEKIAVLMGCSGAHRTESGWHPCETQEDLMTLIRRGAAGLREAKDRQRQSTRKSAPKVRVSMIEHVHRNRNNKKRVIARFPTPKGGWEKLGERGVGGIDTLPDGGLVSKKEMPHYLGYGWPQSLKLS